MKQIDFAAKDGIFLLGTIMMRPLRGTDPLTKNKHMFVLSKLSTPF